MRRATLVGVSFGIAFLVVGSVLLGYWLDNLFDTTPWIMLTLVILSVVGSVGLKIWMALTVAAEIQKEQQGWRDDGWEEDA
jgi:F0F1-type ATP synthase assembly protein I